MQRKDSSSSDEDFRPSRRPVPGRRVPLGVSGGDLPPAGRGLPPAGRGLPPTGCGVSPRDGCRRGPCGTRCALCDSMRPRSYWCPKRMNSDESSCGSSCPACKGNPGSPDYYRYPTSSSSSYTSDAISSASMDIQVSDVIVISSDSSDILES